MDPGKLKPFFKKTFFLDLKNVEVRNKLAADLELFGGKEVSLSKSVSFVVSDRISENKDQAVSSTTSNRKSSNVETFNNRVFSSPASIRSPITDSKAPYMTRNMVILLNAMKKQDGTSNVMEICKRWKIKMYPVEKVLSWVKKYKALYSKYYPAEQKKSGKKLPDPEDCVKKLSGPFVKIEDEGRQFKTRYKTFTAWKNVIDPSVSRSVTRMRTDVKVFGRVNDTMRPPLREANMNLPHANLNAFPTRSVSLTKASGISLSVSNLISAQPLLGELPENYSCYPTKRKSRELTTKSKRKYCEVCSTHYSDLEDHLDSQRHQNSINKESYFDDVQNVISSLPQASDFISSLTKVDEETNKMGGSSSTTAKNTEDITFLKPSKSCMTKI